MSNRDQSFTTYVNQKREKTLAIFHRDNPKSAEMGVPNMPLDNDTYIARKVGNILIGPAAVFTPPVYRISCDDIALDVISIAPTTTYIISPTSVGVGVANLSFRDGNNGEISGVVIITTSATLLPVPPVGTVSILYEFRCTPVIVAVGCGSAGTTNAWRPLQFLNTTDVSLQLSFMPNTIPSQLLAPGATSTTVVDLTYYNASCAETVFLFTTTPDPAVHNIVPSGATISIQNTNGDGLAIQFYTSDNTPVLLQAVTDQLNPQIFTVPANSTYFTATAAVLYIITSCGQWPAGNRQPITADRPLLFVNTGTTDTDVKFFNSSGFYFYGPDLDHFGPGSVQLLLTAPSGAAFIETGCY